jgi:cytidine deaminase
MELTELFAIAKTAAQNAYAPYSSYRVGSAVLCTDGRTYCGCNVENSSYSMSICAERNAIFKAVSEGYTNFEAIAIYVDSEVLFPPCGACRQVMAEFNPRIKIIYGNRKEYKLTDLEQLLPDSFSLKHV